MKQSATSEQYFGISAVSKITGISQHLLRVWGRRYQVVAANRSSTGRRLYSTQEVDRLTLIKRLVDAGEPIGRVAVLDDESLQSRLDTFKKLAAVKQEHGEGTQIKVAVLGDSLSHKLSQLKEIPVALDVVVNTSSISRFRTEIRRLQPGALIIESPLINPESRKLIRTMIDESGATRIVVIYQFGRRAEIDLLRPQGVNLVRTSNSLEEVFDLLSLPEKRGGKPFRKMQDKTALDISADITPRRFSEQDLARISAVVSSVECECPNHLVDLLSSLNAFEQYSMDCESQNDEDAALHAHLYAVTAAARISFKSVLERIVREEGLLDLVNLNN